MKAQLMPREQAFIDRTQAMYSTMVARTREKRDKRGRLLRPFIPLGFSLSDFRKWLEARLGPSKITQCSYCRTPLDIFTLRLDHGIPLSRGGSPGFDNLMDCCDSCNRMKGELKYGEYLALRDLLWVLLQKGTLEPAGLRNIEMRLKGQILFHKKAQHAAKKKPQPEEDDGF